MEIIFATNNAHKLAEVQAMVGDSFKLVSLKDIGFEGDITETGATLEANAEQKARFIFDRYKRPVFADDSGLEIDALNGLPGVDSAHYSGNRDAIQNMQKVLNELKDSSNRSAKFRAVIAFVERDNLELFQGEIKGRMAKEMSGTKGFGYDPIFIPEGSQLTFAEMGDEAKSKISHRIRALEKFQMFLDGFSTV